MICESSVLGVSGSSFFTLGFASHTSLHLPTKIAKRCTEKSCQCHSSQNSRFVNCSQNFFVFDNILFEVSPRISEHCVFPFFPKNKSVYRICFLLFKQYQLKLHYSYKTVYGLRICTHHNVRITYISKCFAQTLESTECFWN